jgi:hypothetical protein
VLRLSSRLSILLYASGSSTTLLISTSSSIHIVLAQGHGVQIRRNCSSLSRKRSRNW